MSAQQTELARFKRDIDFYEAHFGDLMKQYPDMWVGIFNQAIVGAAPRVEDLISALSKQGAPPEQVLVRHVAHNEDILILPS